MSATFDHLSTASKPVASSSRRWRGVRWIARAAVLMAVGVPITAWWLLIHMPGESVTEMAAEMPPEQAALAEGLRKTLTHLATTIGERNLSRHPQKLVAAADYVAAELQSSGYTVERQTFDVRGQSAANLIAELPGKQRPQEIIVLGAHYDSAIGTPGANDNASGVAVLLALARSARSRAAERTLRFVAFTNEEQPYFQSAAMGSQQYAERCRRNNDNVQAMFSLETMGYFRNEPGSQKYPPPLDRFYPNTGNFIGVVGNVGSRQLVTKVVDLMRRTKLIPTEGGALPANVDGVGWSDHWAFWQQGYSAVMITDTALFRYPYYHTPQDTPDRIDYRALAAVTQALDFVLDDLAGRKLAP